MNDISLFHTEITIKCLNFKSLDYKEELYISIDDLKKKLLIDDKYERFTTFKTKVLNKAIEEINKYTDLEIEYDLIRKNRIITHIHFKIFGSILNDMMNKENRETKLNRGAKDE